MKTLSTLCAAALLVLPAGSLPAQEKPAAEPLPVPASEPAAAAAATPRLSPPPDSFALIPETPAVTEKPRGSSGVAAETEKTTDKKNKTELAEDELKDRIRLRQAKTRAINEPAMQREYDRAHAMRTDATKRDAMRNYYRLLYARVSKIDPGLQKRIDTELTYMLQRLNQNRLDTSGALDPRERLERIETQ